MPPKESQESSTISLADLQKLSKSTQTQPTPSPKSTSPTPQTAIAIRENRGKNGELITQGKTKGALGNFEAAVGGRDALIDALSFASLDKKQEHFLRLLSDPARTNDSLAVIVRDCDMLPSHIIELFRNAAFAKAHAIAIGTISDAVPAIVKDITDKSVDMMVMCQTCRGEGWADGDCPTCHGKGEILRTSDLDRQKIALEVGGLLKKGGGVNVNVNQQVAVSQPGSFFSKFVKASDDTAYDVQVIDAEKVEEK